MERQINIKGQTEWFRKCIEYLELFRTEQKTYLFPDQFMFLITVRPIDLTTFYDAYISKNVIHSIKRIERKSFATELYSTFYVEMMKNRLLHN